MEDEPYSIPQTDKSFHVDVNKDALTRPPRTDFRQPLQFRRSRGASSAGSSRPWDLVLNGSDELVLYRPLIRKANLDVTASVTFTNTAFVPVDDSWLVLEISAIAATTVTSLYLTDTTWSGEAEYPSAYKFDGTTPFAFARARIPIWRFYGSDTGNLVPLSVDGNLIWGQKLIHDGALTVGYTLAAVPSQNVVRSVPLLF